MPLLFLTDPVVSKAFPFELPHFHATEALQFTSFQTTLPAHNQFHVLLEPENITVEGDHVIHWSFSVIAPVLSYVFQVPGPHNHTVPLLIARHHCVLLSTSIPTHTQFHAQNPDSIGSCMIVLGVHNSHKPFGSIISPVVVNPVPSG